MKEPETREEKLWLFRVNRGDFETACRKMGYEPLDFATWLGIHYWATMPARAEHPTPTLRSAVLHLTMSWDPESAQEKADEIMDRIALSFPERVEQPASEGGGASARFAAPIAPAADELIAEMGAVLEKVSGDLREAYARIGNAYIPTTLYKADALIARAEEYRKGATPPATGEAATELDRDGVK